MIPEVAALITKARRSLATAQRLHDDGDYDFAVSRAYYAMFYLAEAALLSRGLAFSKHSAVIAAFSQHFIRTGLLPRELHDHLREAFDQRHVGDYEFQTSYPGERAASLLEKARLFVDTVEAHLSESGI